MTNPLNNRGMRHATSLNNPAPNAMRRPTDQLHMNSPMNQGGPGSILQRMIFNRMYQSNPQFKQFADSMQGKTPEQAFQEQGLDYSQFQNINPAQIKNMLGF